MSYAAVARKDFKDGIRSKLLWVLMALFLISVVGISWLFVDSAGSEAAGSGDPLGVALLFIVAALPAILLLVPLTGLLVSIKSIVRERELGSLKILLSLPHSRKEVLTGKLIGRSALLTVAILVGFVPGAAILSIKFGAFPIYELFALTFVTVLFGVAFISIGIGLSALVKTETRASVLGFAAFILAYGWQSIFGYINGRLDLISGDTLLFVVRFNLFTVFTDTMLALLSVRHGEIPNTSVVAPGQGLSTTPGATEAFSQPFYLQHWFAFVILALWVAIPLAIGYWRFERADL